MTLAAPSPGTGTYNNNQQITLTATPNDAKICYTIGTTPADPTCDVVTEACGGAGVQTYNAGAKPTASVTGTTIKAIACKSGVPMASNPVTATYTLQVATPTFNPAGPTVEWGSTIAWSTTTTGTSGFHRTQGAPTAPDPTCASHSGATSVTFNAGTGAPGPTQYKVVGCKTGYLPSAVASQTFTASLAPPTITPNGNPPAGFFTNRQTVTLASPSTTAPGGKICYTTNGGTPACSATVPVACVGTGNVQQYSGGFIVETDATTVRAITCADNFAGSALSQATFNFRVDPITVAPAGGNYATAQSITLTNGVTNSVGPDVRLCYSTNGAPINDTCTAGGGVTCFTPVSAGQSFQPAELQNVGTNLTLRTRACRPGFVSTDERTDNYVFGPYARTITIDGTNDFDPTQNRFDVANAGQTAAFGGQGFYVSWDANNIYVGYQGDRPEGSPRNFPPIVGVSAA